MAALTTSNLRRNPSGSHMTLTGNWTSTVGDDAGTLTIKGAGRVFSAEFWDSASATPGESKLPVSISISGNTITVTVHTKKTVTAGRFRVEFL